MESMNTIGILINYHRKEYLSRGWAHFAVIGLYDWRVATTSLRQRGVACLRR